MDKMKKKKTFSKIWNKNQME